MNNEPQAYAWHEMVFCTNCALRATQTGHRILNWVLGTDNPLPRSMDEAILSLATGQAMTGQPDDFPVPYTEERNCDNCHKYIPAIEEVA